jgi:hypothetical protein
VVLYGCETWSLTIREEHKLRVLKRIFGPKRDGVTGGWRKLHNEELHNLYTSPSIIRIINSLLLSFWTLSIVRISTNRKHNVSETGSVSVFRRGGHLLYRKTKYILKGSDDGV